ncbi:MAG TPA: DNA polymerase III subunit alpha, partial [Gammaproteobacteria bacterium]|nr:DNA polymerase III subunit alpha [Gammaproteobacteria bacterium]
GLIVLSGGIGGDVGIQILNQDYTSAASRVRWWKEILGNRYYLEISRTGREDDIYLEQVVRLSSEIGVPLVATNDVRFFRKEDFEAHETRVCIQQGRTLNDPRRGREYTEQQYLRSHSEMLDLFSDLPEAIENAHQIAVRSNVTVELGKYYLPTYPVPDETTLEDYLIHLCETALNEFLEKKRINGEPLTDQEYRKRLQYELEVINQMGFAGYFLIVMEFVKWAKINNIPVGPGRGSGAGSLVSFCLSITDLDPIKYDLLFERLLNPERVSMPDLDIDFCMERRDEVIRHVADLYGTDAVSQIVTFGTMAAKAVVRDVARVQGKPYGLADRLSKMIPFEVGMTLEKAVAEEPELREFISSHDEVAEIMDMAFQLDGCVRNVGRHAGGVVIAP